MTINISTPSFKGYVRCTDINNKVHTLNANKSTVITTLDDITRVFEKNGNEKKKVDLKEPFTVVRNIFNKARKPENENKTFLLKTGKEINLNA